VIKNQLPSAAHCGIVWGNRFRQGGSKSTRRNQTRSGDETREDGAGQGAHSAARLPFSRRATECAPCQNGYSQ
jgi:hypothetical protein